MRTIITAVLIFFASQAFAGTIILKLNKSDVDLGDGETKKAYVAAGKELKAAAKAGEYDGEDVVLANMSDADIEEIREDSSYLADSFFDLLAKHPDIAYEVIEMECLDCKDTEKSLPRIKMSEWKEDGEPANYTVKIPIQISGVESEEEFDSKGASK